MDDHYKKAKISLNYPVINNNPPASVITTILILSNRDSFSLPLLLYTILFSHKYLHDSLEFIFEDNTMSPPVVGYELNKEL